MTYFPPCPTCRRNKWARTSARDDFRQEVLHCMECGFEVDFRIVRAARRIIRRDRGQDVQPAEPAPAQGAGE